MRIGIMSAMHEENNLLVKKISSPIHRQHAQRTFTTGSLCGSEVVLAFSRWGKVAAAITAMHFITSFKVDALIFTGVAGSSSSQVSLGDIVIADNLVQHDMDARPLFAQHEIPLTGITAFETNHGWQQRAIAAAHSFLKSLPHSAITEKLDLFGISKPKIHQGCIASGDKFFASKRDLSELHARLPQTLCVEMEGAAVAQVCHENQLPCTIIRTISDAGEENSPEQFQRFVKTIAAHYSLGILEEILFQLK